MEKNLHYSDAIKDKKPIFVPYEICWLENIDKSKLSKGILACDYYRLTARDNERKIVNERLRTRIYHYKVKDISLDKIKVMGVEKDFDLNYAICHYLLQEARKVKSASDVSGKFFGDIKEFEVDYKGREDKLIADERKLIEYLKAVEGLDVSYLKGKSITFKNPYAHDGVGGRDVYLDLNDFDTEEEELCKKTMLLWEGHEEELLNKLNLGKNTHKDDE